MAEQPKTKTEIRIEKVKEFFSNSTNTFLFLIIVFLILVLLSQLLLNDRTSIFGENSIFSRNSQRFVDDSPDLSNVNKDGFQEIQESEIPITDRDLISFLPYYGNGFNVQLFEDVDDEYEILVYINEINAEPNFNAWVSQFKEFQGRITIIEDIQQHGRYDQ